MDEIKKLIGKCTFLVWGTICFVYLWMSVDNDRMYNKLSDQIENISKQECKTDSIASIEYQKQK